MSQNCKRKYFQSYRCFDANDLDCDDVRGFEFLNPFDASEHDDVVPEQPSWRHDAYSSMDAARYEIR